MQGRDRQHRLFCVFFGSGRVPPQADTRIQVHGAPVGFLGAPRSRDLHLVRWSVGVGGPARAPWARPALGGTAKP